MDIIEWIKKFCFKILNKIADHLATVIAAGIILIFSTLCIIFREWAKTKHSLETFGWLWVLIFLAISGLPILLFLLITKKPWKPVYTGEDDVKNMLELRFREFSGISRGIFKPRLTIRFTLSDKISNVKNGSSKKYLETIANNLGYHTTRKGDKTIIFVHEERSIREKPCFLDNLY
jgi:MFS family permease